MEVLGALIIAALFTVCDGLILGKRCSMLVGNYTMKAEVNLEGESFVYITFKDSGNNRLRNSCGTEGGQITGSGTEADPYSVEVTVDPTIDINTGNPDCGHVAAGTVLTWTILVVYTEGPFPGTTGREVEQFLECNYESIEESPSVGISVNSTEELKTVTLTQTTLTLEFSVIKETLDEYGPTEVYRLGDIVRLRIRAVNNITGLYGYNCKACNTPLCNDLTFPMLDGDGCKYADFTAVLGQSSSTSNSKMGTFMMGHLQSPNFDYSLYAGMAFTQEFYLFRFVGTKDVYFSCNVGYCNDPADDICVQHCGTGGQRKKRDASTEMDDRLVAVVRVEGEKQELTLDYPVTSELRDKGNRSVEAISCMETPEYIGVMATLGTMVLATSILALVFGVKVSEMKT